MYIKFLRCQKQGLHLLNFIPEDIQKLLEKLGEMNICSLFIEGGGQVNFSFLEAKAVDKVYAFIAPMLIGGKNALTPVEGNGFEELSYAPRLKNVEVETLDGDILLTGELGWRTDCLQE